MARRWGQVAVWAALGVACRPDAASVPESARPPPEDARLRWEVGLPSLVGTATAPPVYEAARRRWRTATVAFSLGDLETSSSAFLELAEDLRREALSHPAHQGAFRAARCMAYENVAAMHRDWGQPERGAAALRKARVEDPDCQHSVTRALERLGETPPPAPPSDPRADP